MLKKKREFGVIGSVGELSNMMCCEERNKREKVGGKWRGLNGVCAKSKQDLGVFLWGFLSQCCKYSHHNTNMGPRPSAPAS